MTAIAAAAVAAAAVADVAVVSDYCRCLLVTELSKTFGHRL